AFSWSSTYTLVTLIFISFLLCHVRGLGRVVSLPSFSLVLIDPCGRGGVREHLREWTRTDGTEPARHRPPEVVQVSAGRDGAVRAIARASRRAGILLNVRPTGASAA